MDLSSYKIEELRIIVNMVEDKLCENEGKFIMQRANSGLTNPTPQMVLETNALSMFRQDVYKAIQLIKESQTIKNN